MLYLLLFRFEAYGPQTYPTPQGGGKAKGLGIGPYENPPSTIRVALNTHVHLAPTNSIILDKLTGFPDIALVCHLPRKILR